MLEVVTETEARLRSLGVRPGMRVALCMPNTAGLAVTIIACWRLGAVVVPLSLRYTPVQVDSAIRGMGCDFMVTQDMLAYVCPCAGQVFGPVCLPALELDLSREATIVLTSGSTGPPKGVLHTLDNHLASATGSHAILPFGQGDVWLMSLPMYHVGGLALIMRALLYGGTLLFPEIDWQTALIRDKVTHLSVVPTQLRQLLAQPEAVVALSQLRVLLVGGAPCPQTLVHQAQALDIPIHITYGASEAASQITTTRERPVGSGRVLSHAQVRIAQDSEILIKSQSLGRGYVCQGQVIPLADDQGWFHTGDLGRLDEQAHLFVLGRMDTQFISGGENIRPEEIEQALLQIPAVEQCVVVPVQNAQYGQRPVAFIQGAPSSQALTYALSHLERFKHPDYFFDWPKELAGPMKPNRPAMQQLAESLVPRPE